MLHPLFNLQEEGYPLYVPPIFLNLPQSFALSLREIDLIWLINEHVFASCHHLVIKSSLACHLHVIPKTTTFRYA